MKIELCPEDMLLEYVENRLNGRHNAIIKHEQYIQHLPVALEFSEEFALKWKAMVEPAVKRFIAGTFALRGFLFEVGGYTKRFSPADASFWKELEFTFSYRGAERLYEQMVKKKSNEEPLYPVVLPADALLISICNNDFSLYTFAWLVKNSANWLIKACFVAWQQVSYCQVRWQYFFDNPATVELPLREYLIERAADYVAGCNTELTKVFTTTVNAMRPRGSGSLELCFEDRGSVLLTMHNAVRVFVTAARKAIDYWSSEGCVGIDDERFIAGAAKIHGLDLEFAEFEAVATGLVENKNLEDQIYESIIRN